MKSIIINEIAWMGTRNSSNNEWIELFNLSNKEISLNGWQLRITDKIIDLKGKISGKSYFLLERTDNESVEDKEADLIYKGGLSNSGEKIELVNNQGQIIDSVDAMDKWPKGNNTTKKTMERTVSLNWQTSIKLGGTPKQANSIKPVHRTLEETKKETLFLSTLMKKEYDFFILFSFGVLISLILSLIAMLAKIKFKTYYKAKK